MRETPGVTAPADTATLRKARGAFFTPAAIAQYVTNWAVRSPADRVLEPSCGEAAFLLSAIARLRALRAVTGEDAPPDLHGVELHEASAQNARVLLAAAGAAAHVEAGDFFTVKPVARYDAVIGNPPYVRYQDFQGESRTRSRAAALRAGVPLTNLASSWAAFTVHSALFLKDGGRLGLVLPAELLSVNYASEVRRFLLSSFRRVDLVVFDERVFPEVLEEVVLLLADGYRQGPAQDCHVVQTRTAATLSTTAVSRPWRPKPPDAKWTPSLLSGHALTAYDKVLGAGNFGDLEVWGDTTLGIVTGNNSYFALSPVKVAELGLAKSDVAKLSPPGSRHLRGLTFSDDARRALGLDGSSTLLFRPRGEPSTRAWEYIQDGEDRKVNLGYKCRIRPDWWRVPLVPVADLLLTYMNADTPRLCANKADAHHLNSVHGLYLNDEHKATGVDLLPVASLNSMTLLGAETVGRAYGGGMLKLEPREADRLPVPAPAVLESARAELLAIRPQVAARLRGNRLLEAAKLVDDTLLVGVMGLSRADVAALRQGHADMTARRTARGATRGEG